MSSTILASATEANMSIPLHYPLALTSQSPSVLSPAYTINPPLNEELQIPSVLPPSHAPRNSKSISRKSLLPHVPPPLPPPPVYSLADFELIRPITKGAFGRVLLVRPRKNRQINSNLNINKLYAMKVLHRSGITESKVQKRLILEYEILEKLSQSKSDYIVKLQCSFQTKLNFYLVMEYLPGGDLFSLLASFGYFDEAIAKQYIAEIILSVDFLHRHNVVHCDLKPDNLLIGADGHLRLTDFGLSFNAMFTSIEHGLSQQQDKLLQSPSLRKSAISSSHGSWQNFPQQKRFAMLTFDDMAGVNPNNSSTRFANIVRQERASSLDTNWNSDKPLFSITPSPLNQANSQNSNSPPRPHSEDIKSTNVSNGGLIQGALSSTEVSINEEDSGMIEEDFTSEPPEEESKTIHIKGTPDYVAPEIIQGSEYALTFTVDWWAVGIMLMELLSGATPFNAETREEVYQNILTKDLQPILDTILPEEVSPEARSAIAAFLEKDPAKRLGTVNGVEEIKAHPFFADIDWDHLYDLEPPFKPDFDQSTMGTEYFEAREERFPIKSITTEDVNEDIINARKERALRIFDMQSGERKMKLLEAQLRSTPFKVYGNTIYLVPDQINKRRKTKRRQRRSRRFNPNPKLAKFSVPEIPPYRKKTNSSTKLKEKKKIHKPHTPTKTTSSRQQFQSPKQRRIDTPAVNSNNLAFGADSPIINRCPPSNHQFNPKTYAPSTPSNHGHLKSSLNISSRESPSILGSRSGFAERPLPLIPDRGATKRRHKHARCLSEERKEEARRKDAEGKSTKSGKKKRICRMMEHVSELCQTKCSITPIQPTPVSSSSTHTPTQSPTQSPTSHTPSSPHNHTMCSHTSSQSFQSCSCSSCESDTITCDSPQSSHVTNTPVLPPRLTLPSNFNSRLESTPLDSLKVYPTQFNIPITNPSFETQSVAFADDFTSDDHPPFAVPSSLPLMAMDAQSYFHDQTGMSMIEQDMFDSTSLASDMVGFLSNTHVTSALTRFHPQSEILGYNPRARTDPTFFDKSLFAGQFSPIGGAEEGTPQIGDKTALLERESVPSLNTFTSTNLPSLSPAIKPKRKHKKHKRTCRYFKEEHQKSVSFVNVDISPKHPAIKHTSTGSDHQSDGFQSHGDDDGPVFFEVNDIPDNPQMQTFGIVLDEQNEGGGSDSPLFESMSKLKKEEKKKKRKVEFITDPETVQLPITFHSTVVHSQDQSSPTLTASGVHSLPVDEPWSKEKAYQEFQKEKEQLDEFRRRQTPSHQLSVSQPFVSSYPAALETDEGSYIIQAVDDIPIFFSPSSPNPLVVSQDQTPPAFNRSSTLSPSAPQPPPPYTGRFHSNSVVHSPAFSLDSSTQSIPTTPCLADGGTSTPTSIGKDDTCSPRTRNPLGKLLHRAKEQFRRKKKQKDSDSLTHSSSTSPSLRSPDITDLNATSPLETDLADSGSIPSFESLSPIPALIQPQKPSSLKQAFVEMSPNASNHSVGLHTESAWTRSDGEESKPTSRLPPHLDIFPDDEPIPPNPRVVIPHDPRTIPISTTPHEVTTVLITGVSSPSSNILDSPAFGELAVKGDEIDDSSEDDEESEDQSGSGASASVRRRSVGDFEMYLSEMRVAEEDNELSDVDTKLSRLRKNSESSDDSSNESETESESEDQHTPFSDNETSPIQCIQSIPVLPSPQLFLSSRPPRCQFFSSRRHGPRVPHHPPFLKSPILTSVSFQNMSSFLRSHPLSFTATPLLKPKTQSPNASHGS
ncbi:putative serine/threonine protein kinase [Blattamonas nauphoetae]|uniref:non-specific serine/threonine protein kinase n=1 Tax=Blattamonas nauphoetae TaxID=2049346 RepID=A0ABQ9XBF7_9EUKA|nr:putative serine/threonine protein kinase [Blattamonas nauphoetae]